MMNVGDPHLSSISL